MVKRKSVSLLFCYTMYGMVSVILRRSLVSRRYFVYHTPKSVTDLLIYLHYSWCFNSSTESFRTYKEMLLSWWDWQPWQYCQTLNITTFPISRDAALKIPLSSGMWLQLCQAANIFTAPFSGFKQPKKIISSKMTVISTIDMVA